MKWYEVLRVNENASKEEIRNKYKTLAKKYHPDMLIGKPQKIIEISEEAMKIVNAAYSEGLKHKEVTPSESEQLKKEKARKAAEERIKKFVKEEAEKKRKQQEEYNSILKNGRTNKIYIYEEIIKNYYPKITEAQIYYVYELIKQKKSDYKIFLKNLKKTYPKLTNRQVKLMILLLDNIEKGYLCYNYDYQKATGKKVL